MLQVPIKDIVVRENYRSRIQKGDVADLMISMKQTGQLQAIGCRVVSAKGRKTKKYETVFGHQRLEAATKLGWKTIGVEITQAEDDKQFLIKQVTENLHRKNPTIRDYGKSIEALMSAGLSYGEISSQLGLAEGTVKHYHHIFKDVASGIGIDKIRISNKKRSTGEKGGLLSSSELVQVSKVLRNFRLTAEQRKQVIDFSKSKECTSKKLALLAQLLETEMDVKKAITMLGKVRNISIVALAPTRQVNKIEKEEGVKIGKWIREVLEDAGLKVY